MLAQIGYWQDDEALSTVLGSSVQVQTPVIISPARFILGSSDVLCFAQQSRLLRLAQPRLLRPSLCIDRFLLFRYAGVKEVSSWESEAPLREGNGQQEGDGQQREESEREVEEGLCSAVCKVSTTAVSLSISVAGS